MKKVFALILALALALSMAVMASAAAADDLKDVLADLAATVSADQLKDAVNEVLADLDIAADADAGELDEEVAAATADGLIAKLGLEGTDIAEKLQNAMSNDFVAFLAGMYTGEKKPPIKTDPVQTGDNSSVIAIGAFAALSAAAAAAFVVLKKKEA